MGVRRCLDHVGVEREGRAPGCRREVVEVSPVSSYLRHRAQVGGRCKGAPPRGVGGGGGHTRSGGGGGVGDGGGGGEDTGLLLTCPPVGDHAGQRPGEPAGDFQSQPQLSMCQFSKNM